jgi:hypothetical protein
MTAIMNCPISAADKGETVNPDTARTWMENREVFDLLEELLPNYFRSGALIEAEPVEIGVALAEHSHQDPGGLRALE